MLSLLSYLGIGLLLSMSPCSWPMLPILLSILVGSDNEVSTKRAVTLTLSFILGSISVYTVLGVIGGLTGTFIQSSLQTPWVLLPMAGLLVVMALVQIEAIKFNLTTGGLFDKLTPRSNSIGGALCLGALSVATMSPCVGPALVGILTYIGATGSVLSGGISLAMLSVGMNLPLLIIAILGNKLLPKPGKWMNNVKWISAGILIIMATHITIGVLS